MREEARKGKEMEEALLEDMRAKSEMQEEATNNLGSKFC